MSRAIILVVATLVTAAFAGCFADSSTPLDAATDTTATGDDELENISVDLEAAFSISIGGNETMQENGSYHAQVGDNITFDASQTNGTDLEYGWDFGDGNTSGQIPFGKAGGSGNKSSDANGTEPASNTTATMTSSPKGGGNATQDDASSVVYAYSMPGNYTVTLYVTDEEGNVDTESAELVIANAKGEVLRHDTRKFSKSNTCSAVDAVTGASKTSTFEWVFYANETDGTPSEVANVTIKGGPADTVFKDPSGKEIGKGATIDAEGPFPAGKYTITATSRCATGFTSPVVHTLNVSATYVSA